MLFYTVLSYNLGFLYYSDPHKVKVAQSCPTLWDPMDYTVDGILKNRTHVSYVFSIGRQIFITAPPGKSSVVMYTHTHTHTHTYTYTYAYIQCLTPSRRLNTIWQMGSLQTTEVYYSHFRRQGVWDQGTRMDGWRPSPRLQTSCCVFTW